MYDSDEDVIPCDDYDDHLAIAELQEDNNSSHHSNPPALDKSSVTLEGSDSTNESADSLPPAIKNNLSGVPCKVCSPASFFNPNPEQQWTNFTREL
jgi:hypothetical protein